MTGSITTEGAPHIDAHVGLRDPTRFEYPPLGNGPALLDGPFGPAAAQLELKREGIAGAVLVQALSSTSETRHLLALADTHAWVRGVVGWVDLTSDVQQQVRELRQGPGGSRLVGIRHPARAEADPAWLAREDVIRGVEAVGAAGLAFGLAVSVRELPAAKRLCRRLPAVRFVLEHLAAPPLASGDLSAWGRGLLALAELPNVEATISGLVTAADWLTWSIDDLRHPVELALDAFGAARLMLGSDWPTCLLAGSYADVVESVRYLIAERPANEQEDILGGTAIRTYRLDHVRG